MMMNNCHERDVTFRSTSTQRMYKCGREVIIFVVVVIVVKSSYFRKKDYSPVNAESKVFMKIIEFNPRKGRLFL